MKIAVIGGTGFVGTNVGLHYLRQGHEVLLVDNRFKEVGSFDNQTMLEAQGGKFRYVDIRNANDVEAFFTAEKGIEVVFHLAAQVAFKRSMENPRLDFEINALGTFNVLEAIRRLQPEAIFVYGSTNQVYGALPHVPLVERDLRFDFESLPLGIPETFPIDCLSPYGCSKGAGDLYALDYARSFGVRSVVTRFGGIYGDHQYSYEDHGWVAYMTKMVVKDQPFNRYGHGKQVRDVLYVADIVRALDACVRRIDDVQGEAFNIGGGYSNAISVLELLALLSELTGNSERSIVNPMRKADKVVCYLDISKAKRHLDWEPQVPFREGIQRLIDWTRSRSL